MQAGLTQDKHILLVEDDVTINETLADILREEGFAVTTVENGAAALSVLQDGTRVDAVLLDLMMPVMTGTEFLAAARTLLQAEQVGVVVMSALTDADCILPPGVKVVAKPFKVKDLLAAVYRATSDAA